jgi:hypothetical protein
MIVTANIILETMRNNHEETKSTKKGLEKTFVLFVSSWLFLRRSLHVALRRPERTKIAAQT